MSTVIQLGNSLFVDETDTEETVQHSFEPIFKPQYFPQPVSDPIDEKPIDNRVDPPSQPIDGDEPDTSEGWREREELRKLRIKMGIKDPNASGPGMTGAEAKAAEDAAENERRRKLDPEGWQPVRGSKEDEDRRQVEDERKKEEKNPSKNIGDDPVEIFKFDPDDAPANVAPVGLIAPKCDHCESNDVVNPGDICASCRNEMLGEEEVSETEVTAVDTRVDTKTTTETEIGNETGGARQLQDEQLNYYWEYEYIDEVVTYETYLTYTIYSDGSEELISSNGPNEILRATISTYWA